MGLFDRIKKFFRKAFGMEYAEPSEEIPEIPIPEREPEPIEKLIPEPEREIILEEPEITREEIVEEKVISKIVVFYERISGTRIKRKVKRAFAASLSDTEIQNILAKQYDMGGNFVIHVESISIGEMEPFSEEEIERGLPGSADVSP